MGRPASQAATSDGTEPVKLHLTPNNQSGFWEIHDENGFLCKLESESTAALIVRSVNVLPKVMVALEMAEPAVEYHHHHEGCPIARKTVRSAIQRANNTNPPPAHRWRLKKKGEPHGRNP